MRLFHEGWRRRTSLLAADALAGAEKDRALAHVDTCGACRSELAELRAVLDLVAHDPAREAEPPVPLAALVTRVQARLDEEPQGRAGVRRLVPGLSLAGLAAALLAGVLYRAPSPGVPSPAPSPDEAPIEISQDALHRLEHTLARERAARYLAEAQDVLANVASAPRSCERGKHRVEMGEEAKRSRELLAERALLVDMDGGAVAGARPVLEDVEQVLREVATLPDCAHRHELDAIHKEMDRRRLMMKIDLVTRELAG